MKRKLVRISVVLLLLASPFVVWRLLLAHDVNQRLTAVRNAGLPLNGSELNRWYDAVPDPQNAALVLTQAFALLRRLPDNHEEEVWKLRNHFPAGNQPLSGDTRALLYEYVATNAAAMAKAGEALKLPASRYPIDCSLLAGTLLPHLASLDTLARLNQYQAAIAQENGHPEDAAPAIENVLGFARSLDREPLMISQLVRLGILKTAVTTLERRINAGPLTADETTRLRSAFGQTQLTNLVARALIGERAIYAPYFRMSRAEATRISSSSQLSGATPGNSPLPCYGPFVLKLVGFYEQDFGQFLLTMNTNIAIASRPPPENLAADGYFAVVGEHSFAHSWTFSGAIFKSASGCVVREVGGLACHRLAITALAIEQFRNQHGHLPETLEQLTPALLSAEPEDPFDGRPLRYRRTEKGYLLYSVGRDREDNGGISEGEKEKSPDRKSFDLTFAVDR